MQFSPKFKASKVELLFLAAVCSLIILFMKGMFTTSIFASQRPATTICLKQLLVASIEAAQRGGDQVIKVKKNNKLDIKSKGKTREGVNDVVTLGDMLSHKHMYYSLLKMWPDLNVVSEEKSNSQLNLDDVIPIDLNTEEITQKLGSALHTDARLQDVTVWIDPLDATKEFTEDLNEYVTTMVCVAHKGEPIIGVIHRPFYKQTVWAWSGHGHSVIPDYLTNLDDVHNRNMKIIVSRSHAGEVGKRAQKAFGSDVEVISAGGAGYKALFVAQRKANAYIHTTAIKKWDICAGNALLKTLGGEMTDLKGNEIDYSYPGLNRKDVKLNSGLLATFKDHKIILKELNKHN